MKGNSANHITRYTKIQESRSPFQDITNSADLRISSNGKQDLLVNETKRPVYPSGVSIQSINPSDGHKGFIGRNASERKRYRDRERYVTMTPEQRDAYLQRNREYKRRRKNHDAFSDGVQSAVSQINKITHGNMHAPALANSRDKDPSAISTSCTKLTSTAHKRMSTFLERGSEYKRMRVSNAAGCSTTLQETNDYVCASAGIGQCKWTNTYMDMMRKLGGKRSSDEASCSSTHKENGNLHDQYNTRKMRVCAAVQDHEDHDSMIYVPNGPFPAIEESLIEDDYEDDESCILSGQGFDYSSYRDINHEICEKQVDSGNHIYRNIPSSHHVLQPVPNCAHCGAKRFQYEKPTFCCMGGKVKIVTPCVPDEVRRLYASQDPDAKYFQDNIR